MIRLLAHVGFVPRAQVRRWRSKKNKDSSPDKCYSVRRHGQVFFLQVVSVLFCRTSSPLSSQLPTSTELHWEQSAFIKRKFPCIYRAVLRCARLGVVCKQNSLVVLRLTLLPCSSSLLVTFYAVTRVRESYFQDGECHPTRYKSTAEESPFKITQPLHPTYTTGRYNSQ